MGGIRMGGAVTRFSILCKAKLTEPVKAIFTNTTKTPSLHLPNPPPPAIGWRRPDISQDLRLLPIMCEYVLLWDAVSLSIIEIRPLQNQH